MADVTADELLNYVKGHKSNEFRSQVQSFITNGNIMDLLVHCNADDLKLVKEWCKSEQIHLFHKAFERVDNVEDITFLKNATYSDKFDSENRTWLHIAVMHNRFIEILKYLITEQGISILSEDEYGYTALHYYCQKEHYDVDVLSLLMNDEEQLTKPSKDGITPLEFACSSHEHLKILQGLPSVNMKKLLKKIDKISEGFMDVEAYPLITSLSTEQIWLKLLQKNDKYLLLSYIKSDEHFANKYYFQQNDLLEIVKKCPENGQGILSHIRDRFLREDNAQKLNKILYELTGIKVKEDNQKRTFYRSALFLALLTGRFALISPLLRCCQFDIVPNGILICLICKNFIDEKIFPDQVVHDIIELKDFCEDYCIAVITSTFNKDLSREKLVTGTYMNRRSNKLGHKSIMEVAFHGKCSKYLGLPSCQESLTQVWKERSLKCPQIKFILHSLMHIIFLVSFSFVVVNQLFGEISALECFCYVYGLGYCLEEVRQIYLTSKSDFFQSYATDAANVIDIFALVFMLLGFLLRVSLKLPNLTEIGDFKLFLESRHTYLFVQRLFLCLSLIAFFMRVLYFASLTRILGPKLKMINTMITKDLIPLLFIFSIFLTSFGVTFQSLLFPNSFYTKEILLHSNVTFNRKNIISLIADIFRRATFTIFDFHYTLNDVENTQNIYIADSYGQYAVYFLLLTFMVVVNVMLMNLLIALFSNTVSRILQESKRSWKSSRFGFIQEYSDRTILPPPFNIAMISLEVLVKLIRRRSRRKFHKRRDLENAAMQLVPPENETPDESSISYYIYQAFALSGQRFRLLKDNKDLEYEKEIHFKTIEEKLERNKRDLEKLINDRYRAIEAKIDPTVAQIRFETKLTTVNFK